MTLTCDQHLIKSRKKQIEIILEISGILYACMIEEKVRQNQSQVFHWNSEPIE